MSEHQGYGRRQDELGPTGESAHNCHIPGSCAQDPSSGNIQISERFHRLVLRSVLHWPLTRGEKEHLRQIRLRIAGNDLAGFGRVRPNRMKTIAIVWNTTERAANLSHIDRLEGESLTPG
jgi:hypothetical protein